MLFSKFEGGKGSLRRRYTFSSEFRAQNPSGQRKKRAGILVQSQEFLVCTSHKDGLCLPRLKTWLATKKDIFGEAEYSVPFFEKRMPVMSYFHVNMCIECRGGCAGCLPKNLNRIKLFRGSWALQKDAF